MKETGFKGRHAAAIEAAASSGGQLTPPIMGIAVFIMAGFLGKDYGSLMLTALIPAVCYYAIIVSGSYLIASRDNVPKLKTDINKHLLLSNAPVFVIPMAILTTLLILHYSPGYASIFAIAGMLVVAMLQRGTRPKVKPLLEGLTKGAVSGATIGVACATIGMFMKMLTVTGAASKLASLSQTLAGGNLIVGLVYAVGLSIILGCAMPIVVAYVICAIVVSPVLVDMGLPMITAHFFVFYFAVLSAVTPPVAAAAMVGSRIAESKYMETGYEAFKLILPFFLVPYFLVANPIVMLQSQSFYSAGAALVSLIISCGAGVVFTQGFLLVRTTWLERIGYLAAAALGTAYGLYGNIPAFIGAVILVTFLLMYQLKKKNAYHQNPVMKRNTQSV
jgi:TRAP transporter 4TM/12TM fusion protein